MMTMDTQRYQITEAKECLVVLNVCVHFFFFFFFFLQFMAQKTTEANGCNAKESRTPY